MKRVATIALGMSLLWASAAQAGTTIVVEDGTPDHPYQQWVNQAKVPTPPMTLPVREVSGSDSATAWPNPALPEAERDGPRIDFGVRAISPRHEFWHELGHIYAHTSMDDVEKARFTQLMGDSRGWTDYTPPYWHLSPTEIFGETYAACAQYGQRVRSGAWGGFSVPPGADPGVLTRRETWRQCKLIRAAL